MANPGKQTQAIIEHRIDTGAQVGMARNSAFASGGRTSRLTTIAYRSPRPVYDAPRGQLIDRRRAGPAKTTA